MVLLCCYLKQIVYLNLYTFIMEFCRIRPFGFSVVPVGNVRQMIPTVLISRHCVRVKPRSSCSDPIQRSEQRHTQKKTQERKRTKIKTSQTSNALSVFPRFIVSIGDRILWKTSSSLSRVKSYIIFGKGRFRPHSNTSEHKPKKKMN